MSEKSRKKAQAVDEGLAVLLKGQTKVALTGDFLRKWDAEVRNLGGSMSQTRIQKAIAFAKVEVTAVHKCALHFFKSRGWNEMQFA